MSIIYGLSSTAWENYFSYLENLIISFGAKRILEVGGGANPAFSLEFVAQHDLEYTILDISQEELNKAPEGYLKVCADITLPNLNLPGSYDLIFSRMLAEHVKCGETFHRNVHRLLANNGKAFHFFPTLYAPPFVLNRLLPERVVEQLLNLMQPGRNKEGRHAKFPAYYSWCYGPLASQIKRFNRLGYEVIEYVGFFGHDGYYSKVPLLAKISRTFSRWLVQHPVPQLTSYAYVLLQKN